MKERVHPATILGPDEHIRCYACGADLAGCQAHFDEHGHAFCVNDRDFDADEQERKKKMRHLWCPASNDHRCFRADCVGVACKAWEEGERPADERVELDPAAWAWADKGPREAGMHVVATWGDGDRRVMRSDGVVFEWNPVKEEWFTTRDCPTKPVPGCGA